MPTIQLEAQLPTDKLLQAVEQLGESELQIFALDVNALVARRKVSNLPERESELLLKINQARSAETQQRYRELIAKREDETLTVDEYDELMLLGQKSEEYDTERVTSLAELAQLRRVTLTALMESLGITTPPSV